LTAAANRNALPLLDVDFSFGGCSLHLLESASRKNPLRPNRHRDSWFATPSSTPQSVPKNFNSLRILSDNSE
jgi:hypothetical protein